VIISASETVVSGTETIVAGRELIVSGAEPVVSGGETVVFDPEPMRSVLETMASDRAPQGGHGPLLAGSEATIEKSSGICQAQ